MSIHNETTTIEKIVAIKDSLPKKQRQLCDYILKNHQSIGLITNKDSLFNITDFYGRDHRFSVFN